MFFRRYLLDDLPMDQFKETVTMLRQGQKVFKFRYGAQLRLDDHGVSRPSHRSQMAEYIVLVRMAQARAMVLAEVRASRCSLPGSAGLQPGLRRHAGAWRSRERNPSGTFYIALRNACIALPAPTLRDRADDSPLRS